MARRRYQSPEPKKIGNWWYLLYWVDEFEQGRRYRRRKRVRLAPAATGAREVRRLRDEHLRGINQNALPTVGPATTFEEYVDEVYRPSIMSTMAKSTRDRYESVLGKYLIPELGGFSLVELTPASLQRYISGTTRLKLSYESIDKIRDVISSVLGSAVKLEYLTRNPAQGLKIARPAKGKRTKPFITPEQFTVLLARIREPYASMIFVAVYTGLRISELIGLRWQDIHDDSITVDERYCRGEWGAPKSDASNATIPVNRCVIDRILKLKTITVHVQAGRAVRKYPAVKSDTPEDLVFQSPVKGVEMRDNNVLVRHIKPAARALQIPWVNWQVLRRSCATWLKMAGADVKDAQGLLRHSRALTTLEIYQQFVPESQRRAADKLSTLPGLVN